MDLKNKVFVIYITLLKIQNIVYLFWQIQNFFLLVNKTLVELAKNTLKYNILFFQKVIAKLSKYTKINNYLIDLK